MNDYDLAADVVRAAGLLAAGMLADGLDTRYKTSVSDVVSAADDAAEQLIADRLRTLRPDDAVVGEEGAKHAGGDRVWYIDPVDGTDDAVRSTQDRIEESAPDREVDGDVAHRQKVRVGR